MDISGVTFLCLLAMWICCVVLLAKVSEQRLYMKENESYISELEDSVILNKEIIKEMTNDIVCRYCEYMKCNNDDCVLHGLRYNADDLFESDVLIDDGELKESDVLIDG